MRGQIASAIPNVVITKLKPSSAGRRSVSLERSETVSRIQPIIEMSQPPSVSNKGNPGSSTGGGGPSIRLNLPGRSTTPPPKPSQSQEGKPLKKTFEPPPLRPNTAQARNIQSLHQKSALSFFLHQESPTSGATWYAEGVTCLYVVDDSSDGTPTSKATGEPSATTPSQFALHLRGSCHVNSVTVETVVASTPASTISSDGAESTTNVTAKLVKLNSSYQHADPIERILLKPATSYTMDDVVQTMKTKRHEGDSQIHRGAMGMTDGIRAASVASNLGELRVFTYLDRSTTPASSSAPQGTGADSTMECWKRDLEQPTATGQVSSRLNKRMDERAMDRKVSRLELVAKTLGKTPRAAKITIQYRIALGGGPIRHLGGIHALTTNLTPHIYTTAGTYGDHEGPRCWIPTADSAGARHRASHEMTIQVTAAMQEGLSVVGFGENFGVQETLLHDKTEIYGKVSATPSTTMMMNVDRNEASHDEIPIERELGKEYVAWLKKSCEHYVTQVKVDETTDAPHVIPPETMMLSVAPTSSTSIISIDAVLATSVWTSCCWLPISPRALGFAIGPWRVLEDFEYFNSLVKKEDDDKSASSDDDDDDDDDEKNKNIEDDENKEEESVDPRDSARENGEGIRQAYFAPIFARKHIHVQTANMTLLPDTKFHLSPMSSRQVELCDALDESILISTVGVPHRALSLMRDVLALPAFRTVSYTQVWIPNAVHGGVTSGSLHSCPEVMNNPFTGGAIMDARLLPPSKHRLPHHCGGRVLQCLQARCAIRGWITSAVPLGARDDVGQGYILTLIESLIMSLYELGHGTHGEGGGKGGMFFTKRFALRSGLNSSNLDFLPVQNIEDTDFDVGIIGGVIGAVPVEDRNNEQLWRSTSNGTESHTSSMDEFSVRRLLTLDAVSTLERGLDGKRVPMPSMGWMGSHLSLSYLSSNSTSSSDLGCGAVEMQHPVGGLPYRALKGDLVRQVVQGRAGVANLVRLVRAAFVAAHLADLGHQELNYPTETEKHSILAEGTMGESEEKEAEKEYVERPKARFIVCVNEILKKRGLSHTLFTRALQNLAGRVREAQLLGTLVDVERDSKDPRTKFSMVDPEGFPNSYVRGASELYLRVGVHVEPSKDAGGSGISKGIQLQAYAEPVIPEGGISYGGPITFRVVENEGQFREFVKDLSTDGSRRDWGNTPLHAKPVTLPKAQTAASGIIESGSTAVQQSRNSNVDGGRSSSKLHPLGLIGSSGGAFTEANIHKLGYQAIELIRITNLSPLLWCRTDPMMLYGGRISVFQPDACLAEMLFHDGDAGAQVEALRALAERPLKIQGSVKVSNVYDVNVSELPVRVLGDCLRGTPALHSSLPHTPAVRAQAALAIAQWQNNKAPLHSNDMGQASWVGLQLLVQYFRERFYNSDTVMPAKFNRVVVKKNDVETTQTATNMEGGPTLKASEDDGYRYLDDFDEGAERAAVLEEVDEVEVEEDEEYRVRSAVVTAIASVRAKDGMTPSAVIQFLETVLDTVDAEMVGNLVTPDEEISMEAKRRKLNKEDFENGPDDAVEDVVVASLPYASSMLVADALLALCHINVSPSFITDPTTGRAVQSTARHPASRLIEISRRWLEWELYRERIRDEIESEFLTGVSGVCYDTIAGCAIIALSSLTILRQSTTDPPSNSGTKAAAEIDSSGNGSGEKARGDEFEELASTSFYEEIFDSRPHRSDVTRAACAQAYACISCASDRNGTKEPDGLLTALEFILTRIADSDTTPGLRQTLAQLMMDACSGRICSMQRVCAIGGRNDLVTSSARYLNGPLGASYGGDTGSAVLSNVSPTYYPAATAVNDGARRGLRLIKRIGSAKGKEAGSSEHLLIRVAKFASNLWRTINGEPLELSDSIPGFYDGNTGICATDCQLRCSLLALWQWLWPSGCFAILQVHIRGSTEWNQNNYKDFEVDKVIKTSHAEKTAAASEEASLQGIRDLVSKELARQIWRGEMAMASYEIYENTKSLANAMDPSASEQGIGQPLPTIQRDTAFMQGGWIASAAQQRRAKNLDGGTAVKLRLRTSAD